MAQVATRTLGRGWLQVHAVDEVVGLLRVEGAGLLELVTDEPEATANHEQQQSGDDEAQSQREDGTCWTRQHTWTGRKGGRGGGLGSDLSGVPGVPPVLGRV